MLIFTEKKNHYGEQIYSILLLLFLQVKHSNVHKKVNTEVYVLRHKYNGIHKCSKPNRLFVNFTVL